MAGRADADDGLARSDEFLEKPHLVGGQDAAANADQRDIGVFQNLDAGNRIPFFVAAVYVTDPETPFQVFRGELWQYFDNQRQKNATYLFESNRLLPYSTRRIRQIVKHYAQKANITKRVYPHLFRHQLITFLTKQGIITSKLQLLSGHSHEKNLAIYRDLALSDVANEYEQAMKAFPIQ